MWFRYQVAALGVVLLMCMGGVAWAEPVVVREVEDELGMDDHFGEVVAISGSYAVVGAPGDDDGARSAGAAYVYERMGGGWRLVTKLVAKVPEEYALFGAAVDIDGDLIVVGAPRESSQGDQAGAVYVFERDALGWWQVEVLRPDVLAGRARFGQEVAISGRTIAVGAPLQDNVGAVHVFEADGGGWGVGRSIEIRARGSDHTLGGALDIEGDTLVVGVPSADELGFRAGSVHVFDREARGWVEAQVLTASDARSHDYFGASVSLSEGVLAVGSSAYTAWSRANRAYVFERDPIGVWRERGVFVSSDRSSQDMFASSIATSRDRILIGVPRRRAYQSGQSRRLGKVAVLVRRGEVWLDAGEVGSARPHADAMFGESVAISGRWGLVGVGQDGEMGPRAGAAEFMTEINVPPYGEEQSVTMSEGESVSFELIAGDVDGDGLVFELTRPPLHGSLDYSRFPSVTYTPEPDFFGSDSFAYVVDDTEYASDEVEVDLAVTPIPEPPVWSDEVPQEGSVIEVLEGTLLKFPVLATDPDHDAITYRLVSFPENGELEAAHRGELGEFAWVPRSEDVGSYSVRFSASAGIDEIYRTLELRVLARQQEALDMGGDMGGSMGAGEDVGASEGAVPSAGCAHAPPGPARMPWALMVCLVAFCFRRMRLLRSR